MTCGAFGLFKELKITLLEPTVGYKKREAETEKRGYTSSPCAEHFATDMTSSAMEDTNLP